jgi:hypothetical protein
LIMSACLQYNDRRQGNTFPEIAGKGNHCNKTVNWLLLTPFAYNSST